MDRVKEEDEFRRIPYHRDYFERELQDYCRIRDRRG
jgi:hypothetical protein